MEMEGWTDLEEAMEIDSSIEKEKKNLDYAQLAIERLMERRRSKEASGEDEDDDRLLSDLLSQLESLKGDAPLKQPPTSTEPNEASTSDDKAMAKTESNGESSDITESKSDEIIKELKKVRKQNKITHWLLSVMIVLTFTWQLSEFSLILMVKNRVSHPFRSFGGMLAGMLQLKGPDPNAPKVHDDEKHFKQIQIDTPSLPHLALPELPPIELSGRNGGEDR